MSQRILLEPLIVSHLFPEMRSELLRVLRSLSDEEWQQPTVCEGWSVRDVALHLLGDDIGILSNLRDQDGQYKKIEGWDDLVDFINAQNDRWVIATRRLSRRLLIDLLDFAGQQCDQLFHALDPYELAGPVGWAGDGPDPMWLHIARELTERWMHHQHICEAVGKNSMKDRRFMQPVLSTFVHALPHTFRHTDAPVDTLIKLIVTGEGGGVWHLVRESAAWKLYRDSDLIPAATVSLPVDAAWRLFTRGITYDAVRRQAILEGNTQLGEVVLTTVAIIA